MFRAVVLATDPEFGKAAECLAFESGHLIVNKTLGAFPESDYDVGRLISSYAPELMLVENTDTVRALEVCDRLRSYSPELAVLAMGGRATPSHLVKRFDAIGATVLSGSFSDQQFLAGVRSSIHAARRDSFGPLYAFLPGKAGSGATTVAFNVATSMALELGKKTFVLEADLHSGVMATLLDVKPGHALVDALQNASSLDYSAWVNYVISAHSTDFLLADRVKTEPLPSWVHYHQLLRFAMGRYDEIVVDLPEVVNPATSEIVQHAHWIFVVCTPELASLKLTEQRLDTLRAHGAPSDRLRIVLNRWHKSDMKPDEIADLLECPIAAVINNDYRAVSRAMASAQPVNMESGLGRSFVDLATRLVNGRKMEMPTSKARFSLFGG